MIGEPVVSGLALDDSLMWHPDFRIAAQFVMSPPIRSAEHRPELKKALAGGLLHLVATDHAVFNSTQKQIGKGDFRKIPNGVNGIEERLHVVWQEMVCLPLMHDCKHACSKNLPPDIANLAVGYAHCVCRVEACA